jgi:hypothetical protein
LRGGEGVTLLLLGLHLRGLLKAVLLGLPGTKST